MSERVNGVEFEEVELVQWDGIAVPAVAPAHKARIYYNPITDLLMLSVNGGAYTPVGSGSGGFPYIPGVDSSAKFVDNGNTLELWWKSTIVQTWTVSPTPPASGSPIGLLLALTYS